MTELSSGQTAVRAFRAHAEHWTGFPITVDAREDATIVRPTSPSGFEVRVYEGQDHDAVVAAGRWHSHFDDPHEAAAIGAWLLTPFFRLAEELKNGQLVATWIEYWTANGWEGDLPVYFMNPTHRESWEPKAANDFYVRYRQQAVLPEPFPYPEIAPDAPLENGLPPNWFEGERVEAREASEALEFAVDDSADFDA